MRVTRFKATDANGDGWVSEDEYVGEYAARLEKQLAQSSLTEEKKNEERQRQIRQAHVRFNVLDKDKDGKMAQVEYDASGARAFAEQDADKDGIVTRRANYTLKDGKVFDTITRVTPTGGKDFTFLQQLLSGGSAANAAKGLFGGGTSQPASPQNPASLR